MELIIPLWYPTCHLPNSYLRTLGFPGGSNVKNLPALQETQVWSLGHEDPLEKGMATHSSILVWRIPCTEEPGMLESDMIKWLTLHYLCMLVLSWGHKELDTTECAHTQSA